MRLKIVENGTERKASSQMRSRERGLADTESTPPVPPTSNEPRFRAHASAATLKQVSENLSSRCRRQREPIGLHINFCSAVPELCCHFIEIRNSSLDFSAAISTLCRPPPGREPTSTCLRYK